MPSFLTPSARKTKEQTEEQKFEQESWFSAEKSQEPKNPHLSALKELLEKMKDNVVLNQKFTEEGQKEINCLVNQGDLANLCEPAQKQKDVSSQSSTQQSAKQRRDKLEQAIKLMKEMKTQSPRKLKHQCLKHTSDGNDHCRTQNQQRWSSATHMIQQS